MRNVLVEDISVLSSCRHSNEHRTVNIAQHRRSQFNNCCVQVVITALLTLRA